MANPLPPAAENYFQVQLLLKTNFHRTDKLTAQDSPEIPDQVGNDVSGAEIPDQVGNDASRAEIPDQVGNDGTAGMTKGRAEMT